MYRKAARRTGSAKEVISGAAFAMIGRLTNHSDQNSREAERLTHRFDRISLRHFSFQTPAPRYRKADTKWSLSNA